MHLLRHCISVPQGYIENKFPGEMVEDAYKSVKSTRSKFKYEFAAEPDALFDKVIAFQDKLVFNNIEEKKGEVTIEFSKDIYPEGIGYDTLIFIPSINDEAIHKMTPVQLGPQNYLVSYVKLSQLPVTWSMNVIFMKEEQNISIITIFPGTFAPPFPDMLLHSEEQYQKYDNFWKQHAFIQINS